MTEKELLLQLKVEMNKAGNKTEAIAMAAYMKNHFPFLGIKQPLRKEISKPILKELAKLPSNRFKFIVKHLWNLPEREFQYCATDFLELCIKKWDEDFIETIEWLIVNKNWWDSVDIIAAHFAGGYFKRFPENKLDIVREWCNSKNIWLNRTAILFQLGYKKETDVALLFKIILQHKSSNEFFIQKAIGWALRQYSYTDASAVIDFVEKNGLKPLSKRESLKAINRQKGS
jgi:3-methyladenine DNA glycosylase AlkD